MLEGVLSAELLEHGQVSQTGSAHTVICDAVKVDDAAELDSGLVRFAKPKGKLLEDVGIYPCQFVIIRCDRTACESLPVLFVSSNPGVSMRQTRRVFL
jgi:hypothetical protein